MKHRIVLGRDIPPAAMALLDARRDVEVVQLLYPPKAEWHAHLPGAHAVLAWTQLMHREALDIARDLKVVSRMGVGFDTVDIPACTARGIPVMVANGSNDLSVAEHAMMLLLAIARQAVDVDRHVKAGGWVPPGMSMVDLAGRTALVVGYGRIGVRVARYLAAFHMKVMVFDPFYSPHRIASDGFIPARDLHAALAQADVVTLHCPLRPDTRHLMDEAAFAALKPGALLVNTARGPVVKESALVAALQSGRLAGAGLDVLEVEPSTAANPLLALPNVVVSPHTAASTAEGIERMACTTIQNILDALDGRPDPSMMVNPEILARDRHRP